MGDQYKMIGNAVPPAFARILANALAEVYAKHGATIPPIGR